MALNGTITASEPTAYGLVTRGSKHKLVITLPVYTAENIAANDLVYISGGYVKKCAAVDALVMGMAVHAANNTLGASGAINVAVVIKGIIEQDGLTADATHTDLLLGSLLYLAPAVSLYCAVGQAVTIDGTGTVVVGKCLDKVTAPVSGSAINKVRVLIDFADQAKAWI